MELELLGNWGYKYGVHQTTMGVQLHLLHPLLLLHCIAQAEYSEGTMLDLMIVDNTNNEHVNNYHLAIWQCDIYSYDCHTKQRPYIAIPPPLYAKL